MLCAVSASDLMLGQSALHSRADWNQVVIFASRYRLLFSLVHVTCRHVYSPQTAGILYGTYCSS